VVAIVSEETRIIDVSSSVCRVPKLNSLVSVDVTTLSAVSTVSEVTTEVLPEIVCVARTGIVVAIVDVEYCIETSVEWSTSVDVAVACATEVSVVSELSSLIRVDVNTLSEMSTVCEVTTEVLPEIVRVVRTGIVVASVDVEYSIEVNTDTSVEWSTSVDVAKDKATLLSVVRLVMTDVDWMTPVDTEGMTCVEVTRAVDVRVVSNVRVLGVPEISSVLFKVWTLVST